MNDEHQVETYGADAEADEWFRHGADEPDAQHSHGETRPAVIIGFLATVIVITFFVVILFLAYFGQALIDAKGDRLEAGTSAIDEYSEKRAMWNDALRGDPQWADMEAERVSLPVDVARREVIEMYGGGE